MRNENKTSWLKSWCAFIRLPNIFTVPGDVVVGYLIAESTIGRPDLTAGLSFESGRFANLAVFPAVFAVLALYCFGIVTNDIADLKEDASERPERPLPSGAIRLTSAKLAAVFLAGAGLLSAAFANSRVFALAALLTAIVAAYDFLLKRSGVAGPAALAGCRALALQIGFLACPGNPGLLNAPLFLSVTMATWGLYIFSVSLLARHETNPEASKHNLKAITVLISNVLLWPELALVVGGGLAACAAAGEAPPVLRLAILLSVIAFSCVCMNISIPPSKELPESTQANIASLIRNIIFLQASACAFLGRPYAAVAVAALWIPAKISSIKFKGS